MIAESQDEKKKGLSSSQTHSHRERKSEREGFVKLTQTFLSHTQNQRQKGLRFSEREAS